MTIFYMRKYTKQNSSIMELLWFNKISNNFTQFWHRTDGKVIERFYYHYDHYVHPDQDNFDILNVATLLNTEMDII
jgi:glutathione peroxidase-family protein